MGPCMPGLVKRVAEYVSSVILKAPEAMVVKGHGR